MASAPSLYTLAPLTPLPPLRGSPQAVPQSPQLPVVAVSNSIVLLRTEANGVINYLLSAGLSSECDQYRRLSFRAARLCSPSPTPTPTAAGPRRSELRPWPSHLIENREFWGLGPGAGLLSDWAQNKDEWNGEGAQERQKEKRKGRSVRRGEKGSRQGRGGRKDRRESG